MKYYLIFFVINFTAFIPFNNCYNKNDLEKFHKYISTSKAILIGARAGLSAGAGFISSGERFKKYFFDFQDKYNIKDMYSGSFYPYNKKAEYWALMSRNIYLNRFSPFRKILILLYKNFYKRKLIQCKKPCHIKNYENYHIIKSMLIDQGFSLDENGEFAVGDKIKMEIEEKLIAKCLICGGHMDFNLRSGNNFVQDKG